MHKNTRYETMNDKIDIFEKINELDSTVIAARLGLNKAADDKSWTCPICGHGEHGNGMIQKYSSYYGRLNWWCHTCRRNRSNVDLIAEVKGIDGGDVKRLSAYLKEEFLECVDTQFLSTRKREPEPVKPPRDFSKLYRFCREKYSLKKFVEKCGGKWRGLTFETLEAAGCLFHAEYMLGEGMKVPVVIVPYDRTLYYWRRVDEVPKGEPKCGVPERVKRKPYIAAPVVNDIIPDVIVPNVIVESELDALSLKQALGKQIGSTIGGIIATGGAQHYQPLVARLERQYKGEVVKPCFLIFYDNDKFGAEYGESLKASLRLAGFPALQFYFARRMKGQYRKSYEPKLDANDLLQQSEYALISRYYEVLDGCYYYLEEEIKKIRGQKS